jgi:hypothetical protein
MLLSLIASSRRAIGLTALAGAELKQAGVKSGGRKNFLALVSLFVVEPCVPIPPLRADGPRNVVA